MKKAILNIRTNDGIKEVNGYVISKDFGMVKRGDGYGITDLKTGYNLSTVPYATMKDALKGGIDEAKKKIAHYTMAKPEAYNDLVIAFSKATNKEVEEVKAKNEAKKGGAKMKKTAKKTAKANTTKKNAKVEKVEVNQVEALTKEVEALKAMIEELTKAKVEAKPEKVEKPKAKKTAKAKTTIDTFNVDEYMKTRDNTARITSELIEALKNTKGLKIEYHAKDKKVVKKFSGTEWIYVKGNTEEDTKARKEIFKAMGFRWSGVDKAWYLAPHPLANGKRWASKKAKAVA